MNILEFGLRSRKSVRYISESNQLSFFIKKKPGTASRELFILDASSIQFLIKVWRDSPFHEVIDEESHIHYSLRIVKRLRTGNRVLGLDGLPIYSLQIITGDPWNPWNIQPVFSENPVFLHREWIKLYPWILTLNIPKNEHRFSHLNFPEISWDDIVSNGIGL